jgi:hypothetical protein
LRAKVDSIQGWFDFPDLYASLAERSALPIVEVGSWAGKSTCFLGLALKTLKSKNCVYAVDTWKGDPNNVVQQELIKQNGGVDMFEVFINNLRRLELMDTVRPIQRTSGVASSFFDDESIGAVFIDADHSYDAVTHDLQMWYPKVVHGGFIAGHDYDWGEVHLAVNNFVRNTDIRGKICVLGSSFYFYKE